MIRLENVSKTYTTKGQTVTAVDAVNLSIEKGSIYGIIGYSGAGKSTMLRLLNLLELPTTGTITVDGQELSSLSQKKLLEARSHIGMIFQHFNLLWSRTVLENIMLPLEIAKVPKPEREQRARELVSIVGLEGRENAYPSELSGGQKQRVGIARALSTNPSVLLADEATSALDPETTQSILTLLKEINHTFGVTIVLITHQMEVIKQICDTVSVMDAGRVVETGPVLEIFSTPKHETTQKFMKQLETIPDALDEITTLKAAHPNDYFMQLTFLGGTQTEPVLNTVAKKTDITFSIIQGAITRTNNESFGKLLVQFTGTEAEIQKVQKYLSEMAVEWEVL